MFDAGTGIGASELVEDVEDEVEGAEERAVVAPVAPLVTVPACAGCGALPSEPAVAWALAGTTKPSTQAIETVSRRITRG
jgi:hypothetical protein